MAVDTKSSKMKKKVNQVEDKQESQGTYEAQPVNLSSSYDKEAALRELAILQSHTIADYKTWAKERLKYTDFDSKKSQQALRECNDAYTISMLSNCIAPFSQGVTIGSVMSSWFTYKSAQMLNPQFNQDVSRMMLNMRDSMMPMLAQNASKTSNPVAKLFYKSVLDELDSTMVTSSTDLLHNDIANSLENNTLDDMIMTPRQVAALKLNFMEQFYVDMRQYDITSPEGSEKIRNLQKEYDTALQHLNIISRNGGFDMSVVAVEERALVGLKLEENPSYANVFGITSSMYGVKPYKRDDSDVWAGDFMTLDNHPYYTDSDSTQGAFKVRKPQTLDKTRELLIKEGRLAGSMMHILELDNSPIPLELREDIESKLNRQMSDYNIKAQDMLMDDYGCSEAEARKIYNDTFVSMYSAKSSDEIVQRNERDKYLINEINRIIEKECVEELGITFEDVSSPDRDTMITSLQNKAIEYGFTDVTHRNVMQRLRENYISSMTSDELCDLLWHASHNMYQNESKNKSFDRYYNTDELKTKQRIDRANEELGNENGNESDEVDFMK